jgi:hypothetical protein
MFVICIGLLGVLAVIPYGAYQTAKARNAENTSWLLDAAVTDLEVMKLAWPENWKITQTGSTRKLQTNANNGTDVYETTTLLHCDRYFMVDPFDSAGTPDPIPPGGSVPHIYKVGVDFDNRPLFCDRMTGQDDLVYTTHSDKRTDFSGQGDKILSSGQYTWFFMFLPTTSNATKTLVSWTSSEPHTTADVDILGCYNRVPGNEQPVQPSTPVLYYNNSISVTIPLGNYDFKNTKYVFLSWTIVADPYVEGGWYKVLYVTEPTSSGQDVFLKPNGATFYTGMRSETDFQMLIVPGVMYHKQVNVPIRN